jgi:hypothetical protein
MIRNFATSTIFVITIAWNTNAYAVPITPTNFDTWLSSGSAGVLWDTSGPENFVNTPPDTTPATTGTLFNELYRNVGAGTWTYSHTVTPSINNIEQLQTVFPIIGFGGPSGIAGYSFTQSDAAGGAGTTADFLINLLPGGQLSWTTNFFDPGPNFGWDSPSPITFFFVSTIAPGDPGAYELLNGDTGVASSFAPAPEPMSVMLFGSGLAGLYVAARKRRSSRS